MLFPLLFLAYMSHSVHAITLNLKTDLGLNGNNNVVRDYSFYQQSFINKGCVAKGNGYRVILTGFGLFSGVKYNISGAVISSMASPSFWPAQIDFENLPAPMSPHAVSGLLSIKGPGVKIINRSLKFNDTNFEICFIDVNVKWDFAAAIFIDQATKFEPELILMTGRGGSSVSLESAAINHAVHFPGYDANGKALDQEFPTTENQPETDGEKLLDDYPLDNVLPLSWNTEAVNNSIQSTVLDLGFEVNLPKEARSENNYICNNVSFLLAHATQNKITKLAGNKLILQSPMLKRLPKVGFFHFPSTDTAFPNISDYGAQIFKWCTVIAQTIESQVK